MPNQDNNIIYLPNADDLSSIVVSKLTSSHEDDITIPAFRGNKKVTEIDFHAFAKDNSLYSVTLPEMITEIWDCAFDNCANLKTIEIPNKNCHIHAAAFRGCKSLDKIVLPENMECIWESTFENCSNLKSVVLPINLKIISEFAFLNCYNLSKLVISSGTVELKECAFKGCTALKDLVIPASVRYIGDETFDECQNLRIFGAPNSYAKEYANKHKIPFFYLNSLVVGDTILMQRDLTVDCSGDGWYWDAAQHKLILNNYIGGPINRYGADLSIELVTGSKNSIVSESAAKNMYGLSSHGHSISIDGNGNLLIDAGIEGMYATDSITIRSGNITVSGINHGIIARNNSVTITSGTLYAYASGLKEACCAIYGKLVCAGARLFVSKDNSSEPIATESYLHQKYACITYDKNCTFEKAKTVFNGCTFGTNSQIITGSVGGSVIGSDTIVNRSDLGDSTNSKKKNRFCPYCGEMIADEDARFCSACGKQIRS